jgi:hypothetical protein
MIVLPPGTERDPAGGVIFVGLSVLDLIRRHQTQADMVAGFRRVEAAIDRDNERLEISLFEDRDRAVRERSKKPPSRFFPRL